MTVSEEIRNGDKAVCFPKAFSFQAYQLMLSLAALFPAIMRYFKDRISSSSEITFRKCAGTRVS